MKLKLAAVFLLAALTAWLVPSAKIVASQTETKVEQVAPPSNEPSPEPVSISPSKPKAIPLDIGKPKPSAETGVYSGRNYSKDEVQQLIRDYSAVYGISADLPLRIARCESGFNQFSRNNHSTASGVFQYLNSTWKATDQGKIGLSVFDAEANVKAAVSYIASRGHARPWTASQPCWN